MKAYEFTISINKEGKVVIPQEVKKYLPKNEEIRCIALVMESNEKKHKSSVNEISQQEYNYGLTSSEAIYDDF